MQGLAIEIAEAVIEALKGELAAANAPMVPLEVLTELKPFVVLAEKLGRVKDGVSHLTNVSSFEVDVSLEGNIILCQQLDQPDLIGKVGSILGEENVNVSFMNVGRIAAQKQAVMAIGVDDEQSSEALKKIGQVPYIDDFVFIKL